MSKAFSPERLSLIEKQHETALDVSSGQPHKSKQPEKFFDNRISLMISGNQTEWLTSKEAAAYLKIPIQSLMNMTSSGKIPYCKLGKRNRYRISELRGLLLQNRRGEIHER